MAYLYPYGDSQQLNLSWFLAKFKELYEYVMNLDPGESSMDTILSRFTEQYDPSTTYAAGDYCIFDGYIYKAIRTTSGMFDSGSWAPALPVNDIQGLRILISQISQSVEDLGDAAVTDVQYTPGAATANGLLQKTVNGSASTVMTVDKKPTENSQNPVKSGSVYKELTEIKGSLNAVETNAAKILPIITGETNNSGYTIRNADYFEANGDLYKATGTISPNNAWRTYATAVSNTAINELSKKFWVGTGQTPNEHFNYLDVNRTVNGITYSHIIASIANNTTANLCAIALSSSAFRIIVRMADGTAPSSNVTVDYILTE